MTKAPSSEPPASKATALGTAYWRLWWANAVDSVGDGASAAALPLLAVTLTKDPRVIAVISMVTYLPWLLVSLPAGALADRYDRAALMWRAQLVQCAVVAVIAARS
jgi:MFS family permease